MEAMLEREKQKAWSTEASKKMWMAKRRRCMIDVQMEEI